MSMPTVSIEVNFYKIFSTIRHPRCNKWNGNWTRYSSLSVFDRHNKPKPSLLFPQVCR